MDCSSPTNKRAREQQPNPRLNVIYMCWQRVILKVAIFLKPVARLAVSMFAGSVDASVAHVRNHLGEIPPEILKALRDDVNDALNRHQSEEFELFKQYREWKKAKSATGSSKDGSFMMINEKDDDAVSQLTLESGYTHFNTRTGSRGRRLATPSPSSPPRGPPPPLPVNQSTNRKANSSSSSRTTSIKTSAMATSATTGRPSNPGERDKQQLERETNAVVTDKKVQQEIFTATFNVLWRDIPICQCNMGCKVELSATTQNPSRVFFNCSNPEPQNQCGTFVWSPVQPLLDEEYAETRARVCQGYPRSLTARESLVRVLQDLCPHHSVIASGSNAFVHRTRCRACQKVISIEHKNNRSPEMKSSSEAESYNPEDYQAFLQWKRDRY